MGKIVWHYSFRDSSVGLYDELKLFLNVFQTAALLEVFYILMSLYQLSMSVAKSLLRVICTVCMSVVVSVPYHE